jgi:hypothetical protein
VSRINRSVVSYAFLAQAKRSEGDLLSGLMPIFKPIAKILEGEKFEPNKFSDLAADLYGLSVSSWAIEGLAPRLEAAGVLTRNIVHGKVSEYIYSHIEEEFNAVTEADISLVLDRFVEFAMPIIESHGGLELTADGIKEAFLEHIVDIDFVAALLRPTRKLSLDNKQRLGLPKPAAQVEIEEERTKNARIDTLCAAFIIDLYSKDQELYDLISRITAGALVSEVVLNFQDPETGISLKGLRVMLDAPLLMEVLDLDGKDSHKVSSTICAQLAEHGARLGVFRHSVEELKDNLSAVISAYEIGEGFGPTARRLADSTFRAYATAMRLSPEARLKAAGIEIIDSPKSAQAYGYFTEQDETQLCQSLGFYQNRRAQERDAASIAGVVRLRSGIKVKTGKFHTCRAVFLTSNPWLASKSSSAQIKARVYEEGDVAAAITSRDIAGLLWVLYGGKAGSLPAQVLLANCAAAIEPKTDLIQRMHGFLSKIDENQAKYFEALMTEERASQYLSQLSLGDSIFITENNAAAVLEAMKQSLLEEHEVAKLESDKKNQKILEETHKAHSEVENEYRDKLLNAGARIFEVEQESRDSQQQIEDLKLELSQARKDKEKNEKRIIELSVKSAVMYSDRIILTVAIVAAAISIVGAILSSMNNMPYLSYAGYFIAAMVVFCSFWKVPEKIFGSTIDRFRLAKLKDNIDLRGLDPEILVKWDIDWNAAKAERVERLGIEIEIDPNPSK